MQSADNHWEPKYLGVLWHGLNLMQKNRVKPLYIICEQWTLSHPSSPCMDSQLRSSSNSEQFICGMFSFNYRKLSANVCTRWGLIALDLIYCETWGVGFSDLVSWPGGGLLVHGLLLPRAGELWKSSSSSNPFAASYCVFSSLVMSLSSSSPNSPPISVGSPTTMTSKPVRIAREFPLSRVLLLKLFFVVRQGIWLDRLRLPTRDFFLLLVFALFPALLFDVLLVEFFLFLLLVVVCRVGSAGGATILCHFWNKHVFRQSRGLKLYVLCLDISSCIGSSITHNLR